MVPTNPTGSWTTYDKIFLYDTTSLLVIVVVKPYIANYRQTSNISRTKCPNLDVSCLPLLLSLPNPLKPGVQSRMKMWSEQRRQAMFKLYLSDQQFEGLLKLCRILDVWRLTVFSAMPLQGSELDILKFGYKHGTTTILENKCWRIKKNPKKATY